MNAANTPAAGAVAGPVGRLPRMAILADYAEENWPSMDLAAEMLAAELRAKFGDRVSATRVVPRFRRRAARMPVVGQRGAAVNADRLLNRLWDYPRFAGRIASDYDLFHVADHSYSQLVHRLPPARTGVYLHDLDTFRSVLDPAREPRPRWFRAMATHVLRGLQRAAVVFYSTTPVYEQVRRAGILDPAKLVHAPYGTSPEFTAEAPSAGEPWHDLLENFVPPADSYLLHVGSNIPRKRIDVLLDVVAELRHARPELVLVQVGGDWNGDQREQLRRLGLAGAVRQLRGLSRLQLASLYRGARLVLQPSEAEGFGLPVIEALACGAAVLASDIPVLREVGGAAATYRPVGEVAAWAAAADAILRDGPVGGAPPRHERLARAARFSWRRHAETILDAYLRLI